MSVGLHDDQDNSNTFSVNHEPHSTSTAWPLSRSARYHLPAFNRQPRHDNQHKRRWNSSNCWVGSQTGYISVSNLTWLSNT